MNYGRKRCPKCGKKRTFTGNFCVPCERPVIHRRMPKQNIPGIIKHLASMGIAAEAVETSPGNITIRKLNETVIRDMTESALSQEQTGIKGLLP